MSSNKSIFRKVKPYARNYGAPPENPMYRRDGLIHRLGAQERNYCIFFSKIFSSSCGHQWNLDGRHHVGEKFIKKELLAKRLSEVNFPAPGGGEALWVRRGR